MIIVKLSDIQEDNLRAMYVMSGDFLKMRTTGQGRTYSDYIIKNIPGVIDVVLYNASPEYLESLIFDNEESAVMFTLRNI